MSKFYQSNDSGFIAAMHANLRAPGGPQEQAQVQLATPTTSPDDEATLGGSSPGKGLCK